MKQKLASSLNQLRVAEHGPKIVVACASHALHDVAAQVVAYVCMARGCRTHFLGANLPMEELAVYCRHIQPTLTLLSLTGPLAELDAQAMAKTLSATVGTFAPIGIGGQGAISLASVFEQEKIKVFRGLRELEAHLLSLTL